MGECNGLAKWYPCDIQLVHYNIQRLLNVLYSFTITHKSKPFSLVCLTEIWLTKDVVDHEVNLTGYSVIRRDRNSAGKVRDGGVAIYIDDELSAARRSDLEHATLEHIVLEIRSGGKKEAFPRYMCIYSSQRCCSCC